MKTKKEEEEERKRSWRREGGGFCAMGRGGALGPGPGGGGAGGAAPVPNAHLSGINFSKRPFIEDVGPRKM